MTKPLMILISGPYMSGANGDEAAIGKNLKAMEDYALPIFAKGHLAVVGEWLAWPVIRQAGGDSHSSRGADLEMAKAKELGKRIFLSLEEIPAIN
jgi:hypothetical protein